MNLAKEIVKDYVFKTGITNAQRQTHIQRDNAAQLFEKALKVTDAADVPFASKLLKAIDELAMLSHGGYDTELALRADPVLMKTWLSLPGVNILFGNGDDLARTTIFYISKMSAAERAVVDRVMRQLPVNSSVLKMYMRFVPLFSVNSTLPCNNMSVVVVDPTAKPKLTRYNLGGRAVPFRVSTSVPDWIVSGIESWMQFKCGFAHNILDNIRDKNGIQVFVIRRDTVLAAATCRRGSHTLFVKFLCSSKLCKGAGTMVMLAIEKYAAMLGSKRVRLESTSNARQFYYKVGYDDNSNDNNYKVKYLRVSAPRKIAKRARNVSANAKARERVGKSPRPASSGGSSNSRL